MTRPDRPGPVAITARRQRQLLTPEGIVLPLTIASRSSRAAALLIDLGLLYGLILVTSLVLLWLGAGVGMTHASGKGGGPDRAIQALVVLWFIAMFLFRYAWFAWFELGPRGATPGKRLTGIRVAARNGGRLTTEAVIARNLLREIELTLPVMVIVGMASGGDGALAGWAGAALFGLFLLFPFCNRDALRCGDVIAGTWVVEAPKRPLAQALSAGAASGTEPSPVTGVRYHFAEADLAIYGEYELKVLEQVLRDGQPSALADVATAICRKIGWRSVQGDERAFLQAYYTQLRARLESGMRLGRRKASKFD